MVTQLSLTKSNAHDSIARQQFKWPFVIKKKKGKNMYPLNFNLVIRSRKGCT